VFFSLLEITKFEDFFPNLKNQTRNDKGGCETKRKEKGRIGTQGSTEWVTKVKPDINSS
jgi:hypothetical protein